MNLPPELNNIQENSMMENMNMDGEENKDFDELIAHFDREELRELVGMMGGNEEDHIDPASKLFDLRPLEQILNLPEIQDALSSVIQSYHQQKYAEGGQVEIGRPIAPELEELRSQGRNGDTELAIINPGLIKIFEEWSGEKTKINPRTDLPEYGFFKTLLRIVAPIVGTFLGGPIGGALASGVTGKLMGDSWGKALGQAAIGGIGALAAPMIGGAFQNSFPGASQALGNATRGIFGNTVGNAIGKSFTPGQGGMGLLGSLGAGVSRAPGQLAAQGIGNAATQGASQGIGSGLLSSLGSNAIPLAAAGFMAYKGHQQEQKALQDYDAKQRAEYDSIKNRPGFNTPWKKPKPYSMELRPGQISAEDLASGKQRQYFEHAPLDKIDYQLKEGGPIQGSGKGQQANIPKNIKENSYIIDASSVSDIGDGSTQAGFKQLESFFSKIPSSPMRESKGGFIKALVSDGEYEVSPDKVSSLGGGSNQKGAKIIENMIKQIRDKKRTSGNKLPPKAKPLGGYLRNINAA